MVGSRTPRAKRKTSEKRGHRAKIVAKGQSRRKATRPAAGTSISKDRKPEPAIAPVAVRTRGGDTRSWRRAAAAVGAIGLAVVVAACSRGGSSRDSADGFGNRGRTSSVDAKYGTSPSPRVMAEGQRIPKGGGSYKIGAPYRVAGRWYVPQEDPNYDRAGVASWYGTDFHGRKTANGEIYDMDALTAAHPTLPLPSYAYVTNIANGRTVLVRINDRGPYAHDRVIDLSRRVARLIGSEQSGLTQVRVRFAGRAPLDGNDRREWEFVSQQPWYRTTLAAGPQNGSWGRPMGAGGVVVD